MTKLPSPCADPFCPIITTARYCGEHKTEKWDEDRASFRERGYSAAWKKLSKRYRAQNPLCERCEERGETVPANVTHHKQPIQDGGALLDWGNLEALCHACHNREHRGAT